MSEQPMFSVVLPTHNRASILSRSLHSVLNQTFQQWELIVVDDGSTDGTREAVLGIGDQRVHYLHQQNSGVAVARNRGICQARGQYVAFLDDDDEYAPKHLQTVREELRRQGDPEALLYTLCLREKDGVHAPFSDVRGTAESPIMLGYNPDMSTVVVHRDILLRHRFNTSLTRYSDADLWGRIALHHPVLRCEAHTVVTHVHGADKLSRLTLATLDGRKAAYDHIFATRALRVPIPAAARRRQLRSLSLGYARYYADAGSIKSLGHLVRLAMTDPRSLHDRRLWTTLAAGLSSVVGRGRHFNAEGRAS